MALSERGTSGVAWISGAAACVLVLSLALGAGWWLLGASGGSGTTKSVEMELPAQGGGQEGGVLTPPSENSPPSPRLQSGDDSANRAPLVAPGSDGGVVAPSVTVAAFSRVPVAKSESTPIKGADPALLEHKGGVALPKIAEDGRMAWRVYARPFESRDDRPRLAIIVAGLGLSHAATEAAIRRLPGSVTLAIDPHAVDAGKWAELASRFGHEVLLSLPLEADDFPFDDPGPHALLTSLEGEENLRRLETVLGQATGYVGVLGVMGSKFLKSDQSLRPVLEALRGRGVMYVEGYGSHQSLAPKIATEIGLPRALVDLTLDDDPSKAAIERQLTRLEDVARERAIAVGLALPYPVVVKALSQWIATLKEKDLVLAPVSAVADRQFLP